MALQTLDRSNLPKGNATFDISRFLRAAVSLGRNQRQLLQAAASLYAGEVAGDNTFRFRLRSQGKPLFNAPQEAQRPGEI